MAIETVEMLMIKRLKISIKDIKNGKEVTSEDRATAERRLKTLKELNVGMYEEYNTKYHSAVSGVRNANVKANR